MSLATATQKREWDQDGCLILVEAIAGEELSLLTKTFDHLAESYKAEWLQAVARGEATGTFYDIPEPLEKAEIFVDLVDHPVWFNLLQEFADGELLFLGPQMRTLPPWPLSYIGWHPDVSHDNPLHIKVQIYLDNVEPGCGEFGYVPGSHKVNSGPYSRPQWQRSMPGHRTFPAAAGTAIIFNSYGWHTAMDNGSTVRRSIILSYEKRTPAKLNSERFAAIASQCTSPQRRALFGLQD